ncbi:MAG: deoxyuridine 5'-triphosphate nucleotidohydrolase [Acutalibacteraceae bacterium]|nr:dUTP diphosphatase [Oscillospiraceae bacterium]
MNRIAKFELVSFGEFKKGYIKNFGDENEEKIREIYGGISLPTRATAGSAGYDFRSPVAFELKPNETINIPTGIRVKMQEGWVLTLYPRSGLGFKYRMQLNNTVGVIDSDYYYSDNEGHIFIKFTNATNENKIISVAAGDGVAQGIFLNFGITEDDNVTQKRNGGFGSTGK